MKKNDSFKDKKRKKGRRGSQAQDAMERHMSKPNLKSKNRQSSIGERRRSSRRRSSVHMHGVHGVFGKDINKKSFHTPETLKLLLQSYCRSDTRRSQILQIAICFYVVDHQPYFHILTRKIAIAKFLANTAI